ncbi:CpaD family pilus assembly protein [Sphingomonas sp.]|uniref:CpaD family pilus assembly protein n=1 Tax=Sphingomonas sp. TaxID=28214 RepID=UPI003AFFB0F5
MLKRSLLLSFVAPSLLLGGCMGGTENRGVESVHQPVVTRQDYLLDLQTAGNRLGAGEQARLNGWLAALRLSYGDRVSIDDPGNDGGVRDDVAQSVANFGVLLSDQHPVTNAPIAPGTVRVVVSHSRATVPGCPDWSRDSSVDYNQNTSSNYGCAVNSSLAAMIAQPEDLVHGTGPGANDTRRAVKTIDAYRKAPPSGGGGTTVASPGGN